jgi:hypothetical protein
VFWVCIHLEVERFGSSYSADSISPNFNHCIQRQRQMQFPKQCVYPEYVMHKCRKTHTTKLVIWYKVTFKLENIRFIIHIINTTIHNFNCNCPMTLQCTSRLFSYIFSFDHTVNTEPDNASFPLLIFHTNIHTSRCYIFSCEQNNCHNHCVYGLCPLFNILNN